MPSLPLHCTLRHSTLRENVVLSNFCTLKIGGAARYFAEVSSIRELQELKLWSRRLDINSVIIGRGSNIFFDDRGYEGLIIRYSCPSQTLTLHGSIERLSDSRDAGLFILDAGASLPRITAQAARLGYGGLEFACGIPATVGGATFMNAGAHGHAMGDCIVKVEFIDEEGRVRQLSVEELDFGYRTTLFHQHPDWVITRVFLKLYADPNVKERFMQWVEYRRQTQPYDVSSAGCFFANPTSMDSASDEIVSAGALIERVGLKGVRFGPVGISAKHANFLVTFEPEAKGVGDALKNMVDEVRRRVYESFGLILKSEVRFLRCDAPYPEKI